MQPLTEPDKAPQALVALGANLPGAGSAPSQTLTRALEIIVQNTIGPVSASRLFSTPAMPAGSGPDYINAAASIRWSGTAEALLDLLHRIEADLGRTRKGRWTARIIDLDLIALEDAVHPDRMVQTDWAAMPPDRAAIEMPDRLILPHPRMAERSFVLVPLADVAPDWCHPVTGLRVAQMLAARPAPERAGIVAVPWPGMAAPSPLSFGRPDDT